MRTKNVPPSALEELRRNLERLKLHEMARHLDEALEHATRLEQGYIACISGLVERELLCRGEAGTKRRTTAAKFPAIKTFDTFDWAFQPGLNVQLVKDLQALHFIEQGRAVLLLGIPGTGKTHISTAYGLLAVARGYSVRFYKAAELLAELYATLADGSTAAMLDRLARVDLLIIDDLRHIPPRPEYATLMFDLVEARHLKRSTMISSNLSIKAWAEVLGNPALCGAMVDRLMERAHVINVRQGRSYRSEGPDAPADRPASMEPPVD